MEVITKDELHARFKAQGVSSREHVAFNCPICGTTQSMASLLKAGAHPEKVENAVGFSCEGRFSGAGPWPSPTDKSKKATVRRKVRGCDWTLGGFFRLHTLEVEINGKRSPVFQVASPEQAKALELAQGIEARSDETPLGGSAPLGESPVAGGDAPKNDVPAREVAERGQ